MMEELGNASKELVLSPKKVVVYTLALIGALCVLRMAAYGLWTLWALYIVWFAIHHGGV